MIPSRYYSILGLQQNANERDVKRAYRTLAKQYHPDINPSKEAHTKFLKITEAYEIITGQRPLPKSRTRTASTQAASNTKTPEQEQRERFERIKKQKEKQERIEYLQQRKKHEILRRGWRRQLFETVVFASLISIVLITVDYHLPDNVTKHRVIKTQFMGESLIHSRPFYSIYYDDGKKIEVIGTVAANFEVNDVFYITRSKIMNEKREMLLYNKAYILPSLIKSSIFSILPFAYIFLIIPIISWFYRNNIWAFQYNFYFTVYASGFFLLHFFLEELRILRILHIIN